MFLLFLLLITARSRHITHSAPADGVYRNITLRNVTVNNSTGRYGANMLMSSTNPATGIVFDSVQQPRHHLQLHVTCLFTPVQVVFKNSRSDEVYVRCEGVEHGIATGNTWPIPPCFADNTARASG